MGGKFPIYQLVSLKEIMLPVRKKIKISKQDKQTSAVEKWRLVVTIIASIVIPAVIFFAGKSIEQTLKDRELAVKYVEISVDILTEEPTPETQNLRDWAIKNINEYAEIKLDEQAIKELKTESIPTSSAASYSTSNYTVPSSPRNIKYIIVTDTENPSLKSLKSMMKKGNINASYHYIIGVDGTVEKIVEEENIAWHAGRSEWKEEKNLNTVSIGIGLVHLSSKDGSNWLKLEKNHPAVGPNYPPEQLDALVNLLVVLLKKYEIGVNNILTKQDIAPDRRQTDLYGDGIKSIRSRVGEILGK
jgi:hypothetical protein